MSRQNQTFKAATNRALDGLEKATPGDALESEARLAERLEISRTTARGVLARLSELGVIDWDGRRKILLRKPLPGDRFPEEDTAPPAARAEARFLEWILRSDPAPGAQIHESDLARQLDIPVALVRELLQQFRPGGLIEKNPNRHWTFKGFTRAYATEMCDMREMIERAALQALLAHRLPETLAEMQTLARRHRALLDADANRMGDFPALDARFHRVLVEAAGNRFFDAFTQRISIIVHYHYQWHKRDEATRNRAAIAEHLAVIEAILEDRRDEALARFDAHLAAARDTLLASVNWQ